MKKKILLLVFSAFIVINATSSSVIPGKIKDEDKKSVKVEKKQKLSDAEVEKLVLRVNEINNMDVKNLPANERRVLKKELRDIRKKLDRNADGFSLYIGGGALLVIILILILLL